MANNPNILNIQNLSLTYDQSTDPKPALNKINFQLRKGEVLSVLGETGSGKSSLGRVLMDLNPESASVTWDKFEYENQILNWDEIVDLRGKDMTMLFQEPTVYLNPTMCCGNQILEVLRLDGVLVGDGQEIVLKKLKEVGFADPGRIYAAFPNQLSGGECQRVMLLMATLRKPKVLIADEPTSSVDIETKLLIFEYLKDLRSTANLSVILITHDIQMALQHVDRVLVLKDGELVDNIEIEDFDKAEKSEYLKELISSNEKLEKSEPQSPIVNNNTLLSIEGLCIDHRSSHGRSLFFPEKKRAVDQASFEINELETLGILGESGSGKTSLAWCMAGLISPSEGKIAKSSLLKYKNDIQIVFQNPALALSPKQSVLNSIKEVISANKQKYGKIEIHEEALYYLSMVKLDPSLSAKLPEQLSGGERQRLCIAKALATRPRVLILDEAVSSLDARVKWQILSLLLELKIKLNLTLIFISHDFSVIKFAAERVLVMQNAKIIEQSTTENLMKNQKEPLTSKLVLQS